MGERKVTATIDHKAFRDELLKLLDRHAGKLGAQEMLALASHLVGQILALQDQRTVTRDLAIRTIMANIEAGNAEALAELCHPLGRG